jgi:dTDP-4-dehydrorhamnose 3,5-epimerase
VAGIKDDPHVTPEWQVLRDGIAGVKLREVKNLVTRNGVTTELFRTDWGIGEGTVEQIIHVTLRPGALSAWHMHRRKTDHVFAVSGTVKVVLYDGREGSPTSGRVEVFHLTPLRPTLLVVPPEVWHGLQNVEAASSSFINIFDQSYDYEDPDEWRLPPDTEEIPYRF